MENDNCANELRAISIYFHRRQPKPRGSAAHKCSPQIPCESICNVFELHLQRQFRFHWSRVRRTIMTCDKTVIASRRIKCDRFYWVISRLSGGQAIDFVFRCHCCVNMGSLPCAANFNGNDSFVVVSPLWTTWDEKLRKKSNELVLAPIRRKVNHLNKVSVRRLTSNWNWINCVFCRQFSKNKVCRRRNTIGASVISRVVWLSATNRLNK